MKMEIHMIDHTKKQQEAKLTAGQENIRKPKKYLPFLDLKKIYMNVIFSNKYR